MCHRWHMQVFSGGLSSYTLSSMCMAHLQAEGLAAAVPAAAPPDAASGNAQPAVDLQATPLAAASPAALDAGRLLHSFFARFGHAFRYYSLEDPCDQPQSALFPPYLLTTTGCQLRISLQTHSICLVLLYRYDQDAVSVRRGGIVTKLPQWRVARKKWLLAVEDPQVSVALHRMIAK